MMRGSLPSPIGSIGIGWEPPLLSEIHDRDGPKLNQFGMPIVEGHDIDADEQAELEELAVMLERDPWITQAKFSKFQVEEANHETGQEARLEKEERAEDHWYNEQAYLQRGQDLQEEARQHAAQTKATLAAHRQSKRVGGDAVRAEVAALKERQAAERRAHQAKGHAKVMATQEQKERIPMQKMANRRRSQARAYSVGLFERRPHWQARVSCA